MTKSWLQLGTPFPSVQQGLLVNLHRKLQEGGVGWVEQLSSTPSGRRHSFSPDAFLHVGGFSLHDRFQQPSCARISSQ